MAATVADVAGTEKCHVRRMGLGYFVDLHLVVDGELTVHQGHAIAHAVKARKSQLSMTYWCMWSPISAPPVPKVKV